MIRPSSAAQDDGSGVPISTAQMIREHQHGGDLSVLSLQFDVLDDRPDWPVVTIKVDGKDPFEAVAKDWRGFDPVKILGPLTPLLPDDHGRRVALYRCSCGEAGCGVIAPYVVPSPDGRRISWVDFRDYVGVFTGPVVDRADLSEGKSWDLPDLHFDRAQYEAEVRRAIADTSWETPARRTARLVEERMGALGLELPPNLTFRWASPAWNREGVALSFEHVTCSPELRIDQQVLLVRSGSSDPEEAAADVVEQLVQTPPQDRAAAFAYDCR